MLRSLVLAVAVCLLAGWDIALSRCDAADRQSAFAAEEVEFFEKKIRPLLAEHCHKCHGAEQQKGGLRLDSRSGALAGGDSGPAVVPGHPDQGYLLSAVSYGDIYQMPPTGKLPGDQIEALARWIERGAAWPAEEAPPESIGGGEFDLKQRARHWSFQPLGDAEPPPVSDEHWPQSPLDRFILARLEAAGLRPAPPADRYTLLRRLSYDLTGLPPSPDEIVSFLADSSPDAVARVVDRLLASPHYGERWGRHWLDLVRFAETYGHEFDFEIPRAHQYRDYVVRALNADVPYDQFVVEHLAGDLLSPPRLDPAGRVNESIIATGFFWFGDQTHSPVDVLKAEADRIDNQIDVLGKTFLGLTLSCARCHDHKFDPLTARDYYALYGVLAGSRFRQVLLDPAGHNAAVVDRLEALRLELAALVEPALAAGAAVDGTIAAEAAVRRGDVVLADFAGATYEPWTADGQAFASAPTQPGQLRLVPPEKPDGPAAAVEVLAGGWAHSGAVAASLEGTLQSPTFTIEQRYLHIRAAGRDARINVVIDGFTLIRSPIYGGLKVPINDAEPRWYTVDLDMWRLRRAYVELADLAGGDPADPHRAAYDAQGFLAVDCVLLSDHAQPPGSGGRLAVVLDERDLAPAVGEQLASLARQYHTACRELVPPVGISAMTDGTGRDAPLLIRGNHKSPGATVPRRFLEVFDGPDPLSTGPGSGRLAWARRLTAPSNPLPARVVVNRLWHHHFGTGLVATPDDFGQMGQPPTHPELLDWLARQLVDGGWSLKRMHRLIVLSSTYQMSGQVEPAAVRSDPRNTLWHHVPPRRLEAEAIRDALLAVTGRLDRRLYGPGVLPHLTPFMDGRGKPPASGPLDGEGRRSLYINVRRNFLTPMLLAFDFPQPFSTMGRRSVSHVPSQALAMMNNPLVLELARHWGERIATVWEGDDEARIARMYLTALGRRPTAAETVAAGEFVAARRETADTRRAWADLAHTLLNVTEFVFVY